MDHLQRAMTAAAALQREAADEAAGAHAVGGGRITTADREAAEMIGIVIANEIRLNPDTNNPVEAAEILAETCRRGNGGFALALAQWLERWAGEEQG